MTKEIQSSTQPNVNVFFHSARIMPDGSIGCVELSMNDGLEPTLCLTVAQAKSLAAVLAGKLEDI